jgi:hypothetical protein
MTPPKMTQIGNFPKIIGYRLIKIVDDRILTPVCNSCSNVQLMASKGLSRNSTDCWLTDWLLYRCGRCGHRRARLPQCCARGTAGPAAGRHAQQLDSRARRTPASSVFLLLLHVPISVRRVRTRSGVAARPPPHRVHVLRRRAARPQ